MNDSSSERARLRRVCATGLLGLLGMAANGASPRSIDPSDFGWDLSYASALKAHPVGASEFLPTWIRTQPTRPIHIKFASYAGEPVLGTLLLEQPDAHAGEPMATWVVRTRTTASICTFHRKFMDRPCETVGTDRADAFLRRAIAFRPSRAKATEDAVIGKDDKGVPILFNEVGFLSVWIDGRSLQRSFSATEIGPPSARGADDPARGQLARAFAELRDVPLTRAADLTDSEALGAAVAQGDVASVDRMLDRGADIDTDEGRALKAAIDTNDAPMLLHLLERGAKIDGVARPAARGRIFESPVGYAVRRAHPDMARLLLDRGADVNVRQARPIVAVAALSMDPSLVELVLQRGARADAVGEMPSGTALHVLMSYVGSLSSAPEEPARQAETARREGRVAVIARQLVAAGADVNFVTADCRSVYGEARDRHSETMMKALVALGADPGAEARCRSLRR